MEATLAVLNDLVTRSLIETYAIGGAVGAIFWVEPFDTIDLDVFVLLPSGVPPLDPLRDVLSYLKQRGAEYDGEFLVVEGVPIQLLPADDPGGLGKEALAAAASVCSFSASFEGLRAGIQAPERVERGSRARG